MSANPKSISRHIVEEQEQAARNIARIVVCLLTGLAVLSVTTYGGYAHRADVCRTVNTLDANQFRYLGEDEFTRITAAQEQCQ